MVNLIRKKLLDLAEEEYRKFSSGLIPGVRNMLGVRLPNLRRLAREIAKGSWGDWRAYLDAALKPPEADNGGESGGSNGRCPGSGETFEEIMLQGMVIGYAKADAEEKLRHVARFVPRIGNWSVCDSFCIGLKFVKNNKPLVWDFIQPYLASDREFEVRFGVIMLLCHYIEENYIDRVLQLLDGVRHEGYYAKMAVAWTISMCYVRLPEITLPYLRHNSLDDFTFNKSLQKIIESNQVDHEAKALIRSMKRKKA